MKSPCHPPITFAEQHVPQLGCSPEELPAVTAAASQQLQPPFAATVGLFCLLPRLPATVGCLTAHHDGSLPYHLLLLVTSTRSITIAMECTPLTCLRFPLPVQGRSQPVSLIKRLSSHIGENIVSRVLCMHGLSERLHALCV